MGVQILLVNLDRMKRLDTKIKNDNLVKALERVRTRRLASFVADEFGAQNEEVKVQSY